MDDHTIKPINSSHIKTEETTNNDKVNSSDDLISSQSTKISQIQPKTSNFDYKFTYHHIPQNLSDEDFESAIKTCKEDPTNLNNLAYLKKLINLSKKDMNFFTSFFAKLFDMKGFGQADNLYHDIYDKLPPGHQANVKLLETLIDLDYVYKDVSSDSLLDFNSDRNKHDKDKSSKDIIHGEKRLFIDEYETTYVGKFEYGELKKGKKTFKDNDKLLSEEGNFNEYGKLASGKKTFRDGSSEEGQFDKFGDLTKGKKTYKNGSSEEGQFDYTELIRGKKTFTDGSSEEGQFDYGVLTKGKKTSIDGSWEEGEFQFHKLKNGKRRDSQERIFEVSSKKGIQSEKITYSANKWDMVRCGYGDGSFTNEGKINGGPAKRVYPVTIDENGNGIPGDNGSSIQKEKGYYNNGILVSGTIENDVKKIHIMKKMSHFFNKICPTIRNWPDGKYQNGVLEGYAKIEYKHEEELLLSDAALYYEEVEEGLYANGKIVEGLITKNGVQFQTINNKESAYDMNGKRKFREEYVPGTFDALSKLNGEGKITRTPDDGTYEKGNFKDGELDGYGIKCIKNKEGKLVKQTGIFREGVFQYSDFRKDNEGNQYFALERGKFDENNKLQGKGRKIDSSGTTYEGSFFNGLPNGKITRTDKEGNVDYQTYFSKESGKIPYTYLSKPEDW